MGLATEKNFPSFFAMAFSECHTVSAPVDDQMPRPFQPAFGSSIRPSMPRGWNPASGYGTRITTGWFLSGSHAMSESDPVPVVMGTFSPRPRVLNWSTQL